MKNKGIYFKEIEHSADFGLKIKAKSLEELFEVSAYGLIKKTVRNFKKGNKSKKVIKLEGDTIEEIFVKWLNEIIYCLFYKNMVFEGIKNIEISGRILKSIVLFYLTEKIEFNFEIKSATFHNLKIEKNKSGYVSNVIFDV